MRLALLAVVVTAPSLFAQATPPASTTPLSTTVAPELQHPIEQLKAAIESRLPSKIEELYSRYSQDDPTKKYFERILDKADSVYVKSIAFQNSNRTRNMAQVNYRMIIGIRANGSRVPTEVASSWRADLVRGGLKEPWHIEHLMRHAVM